MPTIINSTFNPLTFDELAKPVAQETAFHNEILSNINELDAKAAVWEKLKNSKNDQAAYERYKQYADATKAEADALSQFGLTQNTFKNALNLKKRYASEIIPIEEGSKRRDLFKKNMDDLLARDNSLIFSSDPSEVSIDTFINDPLYDVNYVSMNDIQKDVATTVAPLAKTMLEDIKNIKFSNSNIDGIISKYEKYGFSADDILNIYQNGNFSDVKILNQILNRTLNKWNVTKERFGDDKYNQILNSSLLGLTSAIGTSKSNDMRDPNFESGSKSNNTPSDLPLNNSPVEFNRRIIQNNPNTSEDITYINNLTPETNKYQIQPETYSKKGGFTIPAKYGNRIDEAYNKYQINKYLKKDEFDKLDFEKKKKIIKQKIELDNYAYNIPSLKVTNDNIIYENVISKINLGMDKNNVRGVYNEDGEQIETKQEFNKLKEDMKGPYSLSYDINNSQLIFGDGNGQKLFIDSSLFEDSSGNIKNLQEKIDELKKSIYTLDYDEQEVINYYNEQSDPDPTIKNSAVKILFLELEKLQAKLLSNLYSNFNTKAQVQTTTNAKL
ncbi:MAG: hypothetical protein LBM96_05825 [Methanobrevibacter sp.]|jgi:hypothetical protein|nr:hypothetical protein [Candidatus Methanoflexus mossambicus]